MSQVDQVTQHNASAAEQLSSTAEEMAAQANQLRQLMAHFKLKNPTAPRDAIQAAMARSALTMRAANRVEATRSRELNRRIEPAPAANEENEYRAF